VSKLLTDRTVSHSNRALNGLASGEVCCWAAAQQGLRWENSFSWQTLPLSDVTVLCSLQLRDRQPVPFNEPEMLNLQLQVVV